MRLYLDTSALVKLLFVEPESPALRTYLSERAALPRTSCSLVRTELRRAVQRTGQDLLPAAEHVLSGLALVRLDDALLDTAGTLGPTILRSLDAVHLAAALRVAPLSAVVTYDTRMQDAARSLGLPVAAPGA